MTVRNVLDLLRVEIDEVLVEYLVSRLVGLPQILQDLKTKSSKKLSLSLFHLTLKRLGLLQNRDFSLCLK